MKLKVVLKGDVSLNDRLVLHDVLYVPDFHYNLLSVTKLSKNSGWELVFCSQWCLIQDVMNKKKIGSTKAINDLYHLDPKDLFTFPVNVNFASQINCDKDVLWHFRLEHPSNKIL